MADRRDQILEAFNKAEGAADDPAEVDTPGADAGAADESGNTAGDGLAVQVAEGDGVAETGAATEPAVSVPTKEAPAKDKAGEATVKAVEPVQPKAPEQVTDRPPTGAKKATRENWDKLPPEVRKEYAEREAEIAQAHAGIQKTREWENQFRETVTPYLGLIQAQNSTPMKAVKNLMHTAARLTLGTPNQKAAVIAEIIGNYGVDLRELNTVLESRVQNPGAAVPGADFNPTQVPAWAKPMVQFMETAQQAQQTYAQRLQAEAQREIEEFKAKPFWSDLEADVGLLMQRATAKNQPLTLADAYTQARRLNPEIDAKIKAIEKPAATPKSSVSQAASVLARARNAASSVKGAPVSPALAGKKANGKAEAPKTRRQLIMEQFDEHSGN